MSNKNENLFEKHLDKIIYAIIGIICVVFILKMFVLSSASTEIGSKNYGPKDIDAVVLKNAQRLEDAVNQGKKAGEDYTKNKSAEFSRFIDSSIRDLKSGKAIVDTTIYPIVPADKTSDLAVTRKYDVPEMVQISNAKAGLFRCVADVPTEEVSEKYPYETVNKELKDLDLVSVQAEMDLAKLRDDFYENFAGRNIKADWRDEFLAKPVFAAVSLERKEVFASGETSEWGKVGLPKNNNYAELFDIPEKISDITGGAMTLLARLDKPETRKTLLQPKAYDFTYPSHEWMSPLFKSEREKYLEKEKAKLRREQSDKAKPTAPRGERETRTRKDARGDRGMGGGMPGMGGGQGGAGRAQAPRKRTERERERPTRREAQDKRTKAKVEEKIETSPEGKFAEIQIGETYEFEDIENLIFWCHDDSTEPGKKYKYRVRIGIASPIAGSNRDQWNDAEFTDTMIFWSNYVEAPEVIDIPKRMYIFGNDVKRQVDKAVAVEVAKYELGNWNRKEFIVRPGETIGYKEEVKKSLKDDDEDKKNIDYSTGYMMLDIARKTSWTGRSSLKPKSYYELLYSDDAGNIASMPAQKSSWAKSNLSLYKEITESIENPVALDRSKSPSKGRGGTPDQMPGMGEGMPGMGGMGMPGMDVPGM